MNFRCRGDALSQPEVLLKAVITVRRVDSQWTRWLRVRSTVCLLVNLLHSRLMEAVCPVLIHPAQFPKLIPVVSQLGKTKPCSLQGHADFMEKKDTGLSTKMVKN